MDSDRKAKPPARVSIERAKNGGYVVDHSFDNMGAGESYRPNEKHAFSDHKSMMAHVHTATGGALGKDEGAEEGTGPAPAARGAKTVSSEKRPSGAGRAATAKAPGPRTYGAGAD